MNTIPMCWKCREAILETNLYDFNAKVLTGCKLCDKIKSYNDARNNCPLLKETDDV